MEFEEKVEKLIEDYGAPENITDDLKEFLIESGNAYAIGEYFKEEN